MPHVVLLGDSILDNGAYTRGGPDVVAQVHGNFPADFQGLASTALSAFNDVILRVALEPRGDHTRVIR